MAGATYTLNNFSNLQVQFALCTNLPTSRPTNATYGSSNSDTSLQITTDTNYLRVTSSVGTTGQILTSGGTGGSAFWSSVVGTQGETGATGETGPMGETGPTGADSTVPGPTGATGLQGTIIFYGYGAPVGDTAPFGTSGFGPTGTEPRVNDFYLNLLSGQLSLLQVT